MTAVLQLLSSWLASAEEMLEFVPELAASLSAGSWPAAAVAGAFGLVLLFAGFRLGRLLGALGAAGIGLLAGRALGPLVQGYVPTWLPAWIAAGLLGTAAFMSQEVYPVVLGLVPGALLGLRLSIAGRPWLAGVAGGLVLGLLGLLLRRLVFAATAAGAGAALVAIALLSLTRQVPPLAVFTQHPVLLLGLSATLAVAGTAFQLGREARGHGFRGEAAKVPASPRSPATKDA